MDYERHGVAYQGLLILSQKYKHEPLSEIIKDGRIDPIWITLGSLARVSF